MRTKYGIIAVLTLLIAWPAFAQVPVQQVTGSAIPDVAAFRLLLWHQDSACSFKHLSLNLPANDMAILKQACLDFQKLPEIKPGAAINMATHHGTVRVYWSNLQAQMSSDGLTRFTAFLQDFKSKCTLSPYDDDLPNAAQNLAEASMVASSHVMAGMMQGTNMTPNYSGVSNIGVDLSYVAGDNFQRPNGPPGSNWVNVNGSFSIVSDQLQAALGQYSAMSYAMNPCADCSASITISASPQNGEGKCVMARQSGSANSSYRACFYNSSGTTVISLHKWINGVDTWMPPNFNTPINAGDKVTITAIGTLIGVSYNGSSVLAIQDSALSSGYLGVAASSAGGQSAAITSFQANFGWEYYSDISINGNTICGQGPPNCFAAIHTAHLTNMFGSYGDNDIQQSGPAPNTFNLQSNQDFPLANMVPGANPGGGGNIQCSIAGGFWSFPDVPFWHGRLEIEEAFTLSVPTGGAYPAIIITPSCTSSTAPPDYNPPTANYQQWAAGYWGASIPPCLRSVPPGYKNDGTIPWVCASGADVVSTSTPRPCSNWDRGNPGVILWGSYP